MRVLSSLLLPVLLALAAAAPADAAKRRPVPYPFLGVSADGPALDPRMDLNRELDLMVGSGVQSVRAVFHWGVAQPYRSFEEVPPEERPRFRDEAGVPMREYQAWNEPSLKVFWSDDGWDRDYVQLLKVTRPALLAADPGAKMVLAGLPNESWKALRLIYKAGGRRHFDIAAVHPFTALVKNVIRIVELSRDVMRKYGDRRKPLMVTETSWPSSRGKTSTRY